MFELTVANAPEYLRSRGWTQGPMRVTELSGGVSNLVLCVETERDRFVLKQSRPRLRTRDAWFSDLERVYREQEVMQALADYLPAETVPRVLFVDRENFTFAMSHAPPARVWKTTLLAGEIDLALGSRTGQILGLIHESSARAPDRFAAFRDRAVFVQLRVEPFYRRVQERRPEVAAAVQPLIDGMLTRSEALCHGDYTPKNMLVHDGGFMLVDYETAHFGDPAMDLGLFLTHLLLKAVRRPDWRGRYFQLIGAFWSSYREQVRSRPIEDLETRGAAHWGACLLARIDGTSPVDYLPAEPKRELVRRLGRAILNDGMRTVHDILAWCERELTRV